MDQEANQISVAVIQLLKVKGKTNLLPDIIELLQREIKLQQHEVVIESAVELTEDELKEFSHSIKNKLGYTPTIVNKVNPELLGGIRMQIGDQVIDVSLKNRIEQLKNTIN